MTLTVERSSPTTLTIRRRFAAPPERVFAAHTEPDLIRRWCYGFEGGAMPVCINDARPGGELRWEWTFPGGAFHATGTYELVEPPADGRPGRIVHVERMHLGAMGGPDPTPDNHIETTFAPDGSGTLLTLVMRMDTAEAMDAMIATGATDGMEVTYARIDGLGADAA